ncbi:agmatine deiminase family protein [Vreelandella aquamarina]
MSKTRYKILPEWSAQDGIQLTWPRSDGDWGPLLERIESTLERIVLATARYQQVLICVPDGATRDRLSLTFERYNAASQTIHLIVVDSDDTWARDHGPISVMDSAGQLTLLDYTFTGWGGKFPAQRDDQITAQLEAAQVWACPVERRSLVLEGGGIETDGEGTLLTTEACLLNPNRNPTLSRHDIENRLAEDLGVDRFLWLKNGHLEGDDTDSHIDTLARFCSTDTIAYVRCDDPADPHYPALAAMEAELQAFRQRDGKPYQLIPLPWPSACYAPDDGRRLPATYANFLIINQAVLVPVYGAPADVKALDALGCAFPERDIIPIDCTSVIRQHGSLHCLTMQLPQGALISAETECHA